MKKLNTRHACDFGDARLVDLAQFEEGEPDGESWDEKMILVFCCPMTQDEVDEFVDDSFVSHWTADYSPTGRWFTIYWSHMTKDLGDNKWEIHLAHRLDC